MQMHALSFGVLFAVAHPFYGFTFFCKPGRGEERLPTLEENLPCVNVAQFKYSQMGLYIQMHDINKLKPPAIQPFWLFFPPFLFTT